MARTTGNARFGSLDDEVPKNGGQALRAQPEGERSLPRGAESITAAGALIWEWHAASSAAASHQGGHCLPRTAAATAGRPRSPSPGAEHAARRCAAPYVHPDCAAPSAAPSARGAPAASAAGSQQAATPTAAPASSERSLGVAWAAAHVAIGDGGEAAAGRRSTRVLGPRTLALAPGRYQLFRQWAPASGNCCARCRAGRPRCRAQRGGSTTRGADGRAEAQPMVVDDERAEPRRAAPRRAGRRGRCARERTPRAPTPCRAPTPRSMRALVPPGSRSGPGGAARRGIGRCGGDAACWVRSRNRACRRPHSPSAARGR